jgi:hypothetical protein
MFSERRRTDDCDALRVGGLLTEGAGKREQRREAE